MNHQSLGIFRHYRLRAGLLLALGLSACTEKGATFTPTPAPPTPPVAEVNDQARSFADYTNLVWSDEFDGGALDQTKWMYDLGGGGWGNNELQSYTNSNDNVFLSGGNLVIQANKAATGSYTSGRILTKGKKTFQYGRIDVRAKVPKGKGIWPAIWMLGADIDQNNWPRCGEIDIMELRGSQPRELITTMHFGNSTADHRMKGTTQTLPTELSDAFHVFSVVRSKDQMRFFLDGQLYYTFTSSDASPFPFNNPFFAVLNVAVGGNFDGDPNSATVFPQQMQVDYVRQYQYK
jgi:beta-glucanase (GH16 family)